MGGTSVTSETSTGSPGAGSSSEVKKIRGRRSTKRSRTGCLTCKFRKVKCDEQKPECNRCIAFGIGCDGYEKPRSQKKTTVLPLLPLTIKAPLLPAPPTLSFDSRIQQTYYHHFRTQTASELGNSFENSFWNHLILQACHEEYFVLQAVTALGAFSTFLLVSSAGNQDPILRVIAGRHSDFAFEQYQKALSTVRGSLNGGRDPRKALIASILVCSFEGLVGNTGTALAHAQSGQKLLDEWMVECSFGGTREAQTEEQLMQVSRFFDAQIMGFCGEENGGMAQLHYLGHETIQALPSSFKDISETRYHFDSLARQIVPFISTASSSVHPQQSLFLQHDPNIDPFLFTPPLPQTNLPSLRIQQATHIQTLERWRSIYNDLYSRTKRSSNRQVVLEAHTLQLRYLSTSLSLSGCLDTNNCTYDQHFSLFHEMVSLSREILRLRKTLSQEQTDFSFEIDILPALHIMAICCRERGIRSEALAMMSWEGVNEGRWDSSVVAEMDSVVIGVEEEGVETGFIPEEKRIRVLGVTMKVGMPFASLEFMRGSKRTGEEYGERLVAMPVSTEGMGMSGDGIEMSSSVPVFMSDNIYGMGELEI